MPKSKLGPARRALRRAARFAKKSNDRFEDLLAGKIKGDDLGKLLAEGWIEMADLWFGFNASDAVPRAYLDLPVTHIPGTPPVSADASVELDAPEIWGTLKATPLNAPGALTSITATLDGVDGKTPGPNDKVEAIKVKISVPDNQQFGLYQGFVATSTGVVVDVHAHVRQG